MPKRRLALAGLLTLIVVIGTSAWMGTPSLPATARPVIDIGVVVSDLDRSVEFYQNVLGMTKVRELDLDAGFGQRSGLTEARAFHIEALKLEDSPDATEWKLMSFGEDTPQQKNEYIHDHTGVQYVTIRVNALTPFLERIRAHDVELMGETPMALNENTHFALIQDPDGTFIELIGPMNK